MKNRSQTVILWLVAAWLGFLQAAWGLPDFTFLHLSDVHVPVPGSEAAFAALPTSEPVSLAPYSVTVPPPSFAIVTGDLTEFGGGNGWWEKYLGLWRDLPYPIYQQLGNHDNTWDCSRPRLRQLHGQVFYAFERFGAKFIGWDTATPQDPRPSISTEGLLWLRAELERTPPEQPLFFFCHHAPQGQEFASGYDPARLLDLLRTRNVVLLLVGHGHGAQAWQLEGFDVVMGGSTFGQQPGFGLVSVQGNVLRVCHQFVAPEPKMEGLLEKPLPPRSPFLHVLPPYPPDGTVFAAHQPVEWSFEVEPPEAVRTGRWTLDGEETGELVWEGDAWKLRLERDQLAPGAHTLRCEFTDVEDRVTSRSLAFWRDAGPFQIAWKYQLSGSCQSTPTVADGRLYVGANDGCLYAFEAATGNLLWRFITGGEVRSQPAVAGGLICFGSADGNLYALTPDGVERWRFAAGSPIYASPLVAEGRVICGTNAGDVLALDAATGNLLWRSDAPEYTVETPACTGDGAVYVGAWDRYVYALELADGSLRWRALSAGSDREGGAARYYSPADCGLAFAGGRIFAADRAYRLTILDARSGNRLHTEENCVALCASADGRAVYLRHTDNRVSQRRSDGSVVWETGVPTGYVAAPPVEAGGYVWLLSSLGTLSVLEAGTGGLVGQYRAFPGLYAFAAPAFDGERVYVADMGGNLLALRPPRS